MKPLGCHSLNLNGPVPIGARCKPSLSASKPRGTTAMEASAVSSGAVGSFSVTTTVRASGAVASATEARREASGEAIADDITRFRLATTSAASAGLPSWNVTPPRRRNV
jgi:hypothetical protein